MGGTLLITYSGLSGGAERSLLDFAGGLEPSPILACPPGPLSDAAVAAGVRVAPLRERPLELRGSPATALRALADLLGHRREARRLAADIDPDILVAWGMRSALSCLTGPPVGSRVAIGHQDLLPGRALGWLVRRAARRAALVIVPSRTVAEDLDPTGRLARRLEVIPPGVDLQRFTAGEPARDPPYVLLLGALVPWKRADLALEAVARARLRLPELRLRVVGDPLGRSDNDWLTTLKARAASAELQDAVEFTPATADPAAELARASCLLHCAPREPFGMVVAEALAAGRPVVVPAAGGPTEIADASCGRMYPPGDAEGAAAALVQVIEDPELRRRLGAAGRERARERFSLPDCQARWAAAVNGSARPRATGLALPPRMEFVTVTHNSAAELRLLLASVERYLPGTRVRVVDSGSTDESREIAIAADNADLIDLNRNAGFGAGCNEGVAAVRAPVCALINPDVELIDDSLLTLAERLRVPSRREGLLAPRVLNTDLSRQDTVHPRPDSAAAWLGALLPPAALPTPLATAVAPWRGRRGGRVGWAVGCALVARTETLRRLGPFDPAVWMYGEDMELGLRAAEVGVPTLFCPEARVIHHGAHSAARVFKEEPFARLAAARHQAVAAALGPGAARRDDLAQALTFLTRGASKRMLGRSGTRELAQLRALRRR